LENLPLKLSTEGYVKSDTYPLISSVPGSTYDVEGQFGYLHIGVIKKFLLLD